MRLYELTDAYREVIQEMEALDEDDPQRQQRWEALAGGLKEAIEVKAENVAKVIRSLEAGDLAAVTTEMQRLANRKKAIDQAIGWWKRYLQSELTAADIRKVKGALFTVYLQNAPASCQITDESQIPDEYKEERTEIHIKVTDINKHFKETGEIVPGTTMITDRQFLRIN